MVQELRFRFLFLVFVSSDELVEAYIALADWLHACPFLLRPNDKPLDRRSRRGKTMVALRYENEPIPPEYGVPTRLLVPHLFSGSRPSGSTGCNSP